MKKYDKPILDVTNIDVTDIILTSVDPFAPEGADGELVAEGIHIPNISRF